MDHGARRWLVRTAYANLWRVAPWIGIDDLLQEGAECYYYVRARYPTAVDPPHIMRLFQLTFMSRLSDIARRSRRQPDFAAGDIISTLLELHPSEPEQLSLGPLIADAPQEIKSVLQLFTREETLSELRAAYALNPGHRETLNERLCTLAGLDPDTDVVNIFIRYFRAA